jgi:hypothetical protein
MKNWVLLNWDTDEEIHGQFEPGNMTEDIGSTFSEKWALNRRFPITQFVHGNTDTLSFEGRFFLQYGLELIKLTIMGENVDPGKRLAQLKQWAVRDIKLRRPPLLGFWVGDEAEVSIDKCIIESVSGINYRNFTNDGKVKDVTFTLNLKRWYPWLQESEVNKQETYHHLVKQGEYYELLAQYEYGDPMAGDIIRKKNPTRPSPQIGDSIPLPDFSKIRKEIVEPKSVTLRSAFGSQLTPQKALRVQTFDNRNTKYYSHVVLEY